MSDTCVKRGGQLHKPGRIPMQESTENKVKIRFKFRSGEEFEAEGSPSFIEKQRADFLNLIGKGENSSSHKYPVRPPCRTSGRAQTESSGFTTSMAANTQTGATDANLISASYRSPHPISDTAAGSSSINFPGKNTGAAVPAAPQMAQGPENIDTRLWEEITRPEENFFILRKKSRLLESDTAALLLIAAAKVLGAQHNGISALNLTKALHKSGYGGGRLDRILAAEIKLGTIKASGSKRSRHYLLSDEGFVRAYVVAGKLASEWN